MRPVGPGTCMLIIKCCVGINVSEWWTSNPGGNLVPHLMGKTDLAPQKPVCVMGESLTALQNFQSNQRENLYPEHF